MKKTIALALLVVSFSASAFAAGTALTSGSVASAGSAIYGGADTTAAALTTINPLGKLSSGVSAIINFDQTSYALATKHIKGSKVFGTAADSTNMYWKTSPTNTLITATEVGSGSADANFAIGWTSM